MSPGRILIVDDSATERLKLKKATEALGHSSVAVASGQAALEAIHQSSFDLVLLDIVMPEMDGFAVLEALKSSRATRDLPVIVISALDEEMTSVVKAIELGAEDFLPKNFEPSLLRARVSTCVEKKRLRDAEREYLERVSKLTQAAAALESGKFDPSKLGLQEIATRGDGLGKLASVFSAMAQKVYERERRLRQNIRTFQGALLLLACGALWGLVVPLSKMASQVSANPIGLALLVGVVGSVIATAYSISRKTFPKLSSLSPADWKYVFVWAFLFMAVNQVLIYWMASVLPAFIVSIVIVLEGFVVFLFAALMRIEAPKAKRFIGLGLGLLGVVIIVSIAETANSSGHWEWIVVALLIPLTYAIEDIYIAQKKPEGIDNTALFGIASAAGVLILTPPALIFGDFLPFAALTGQLGLLVVLIGVAAALAMILFVYLISSTGAVFASQNAYAVTAAGIGWSVILLGEQIPGSTWVALGLIIIGLILVEPKKEAEEGPPKLLSAAEDLVA
jgi:CheY-like chemotaxis protein/drug/metabolite transporter (DMT)-like permease